MAQVVKIEFMFPGSEYPVHYPQSLLPGNLIVICVYVGNCRHVAIAETLQSKAENVTLSVVEHS